MKKLLLIAFFLFINYASNGQNLLGWDKPSVVKFMANKDSCKFIGEDYNQDKFAYDTFSIPGGMMVYYFNEKNKCVEYRKMSFMKDLLPALSVLYTTCKEVRYDEFIDLKNEMDIRVNVPDNGNGMFVLTFDEYKNTH
jgi:hypothetical protein